MPEDPEFPPAGPGHAAAPQGMPDTAQVVVVMGVAGCGKTTLATALADTLHWEYQEGDALHPPENVEKMRQGIPLTDEDRWPWLGMIAAVIDGWLARGVSGVVTCSALKRRYRDVIVGGRQGVRLVYLAGPRALVEERLEHRSGHYMPPSLLNSQYAALEPPTPDERPIVMTGEATPEELVASLIAALKEQ